MPMDIEWAKDGKDKKIYILQARPETVQSIVSNYFEKYTKNDIKKFMRLYTGVYHTFTSPLYAGS